MRQFVWTVSLVILKDNALHNIFYITKLHSYYNTSLVFFTLHFPDFQVKILLTKLPIVPVR